MQCSICQQYIKSNLGSHFFYSHSDIYKDKNKYFFIYMKIKYNLDLEQIIQISEDIKEYSINFLKSKYNMWYKDLEWIMDYYQIPHRNISESKKLESVQQSWKETNMERYGVENVSQNQEIKIKKEETFLINYGVKNIFQHIEFLNKIDSIMIEKYGQKRITNPQKISDVRNNFSQEKKDEISKKHKYTLSQTDPEILKERSKSLSIKAKERFNNLSDEQKESIINKMRSSPTLFISKLETRIQQILNKWNIEYTAQYFFKGRIYDFKINKLIIEVQGDYWHCNPLKYKADDIIQFPNKTTTAQKVWNKDKTKKDMLLKNGFSVIYIWETEMKNLSEQELENLLLEKIKEIENVTICKN